MMDTFDLDRLVRKLRSLGYSGAIKREELDVWFHLKSERVQAFLHWLISSQHPSQHSIAAFTPQEQHTLRTHLLPNGRVLHGKALKEALHSLRSTERRSGSAEDSDSDSTSSHSAFNQEKMERLVLRLQYLAETKTVMLSRKKRLNEAMGRLLSRSEEAKTGMEQMQATVQQKEHEMRRICASYLHPTRAMLAACKTSLASVDRSILNGLAELNVDYPVRSATHIQKRVNRLGEQAAEARRALAFARVRSAGYACEVELLRSSLSAEKNPLPVVEVEEGAGNSDAGDYHVTQEKLAQTLQRISEACRSSLTAETVLRSNLESSIVALKSPLSTLQRLLALSSDERAYLGKTRQVLNAQVGDVKGGIGALESIQQYYADKRSPPEVFHAMNEVLPSRNVASDRNKEEKTRKDYTIGSLYEIRQEICKRATLLHSQYSSGVNSLDRASAEVWRLKAAKECLRQHVLDINAQHEQIQRLR